MTNEFKAEDIVHSPIEAGQIQLEEFLNINCPDFKNASFLSPKYLKYDDSVNVNGHKKRLMQVRDYIAKVDIDFDNKRIMVSPKLAGTILSTYTITQIFNNRTNQNPITYHEAKIKEAITGREITMKFGYDDLANDKSFKAKINTLSSLKNDENTEFVSKYIKKNNPIPIEERINAGREDIPEPDSTFITSAFINWNWGNAAYYEGKMYFEDENHNIKVSDNKYIRVSRNSRRLLPQYVPNQKPIEQVISELFNNINESWDGALEPFLAIAFMSLSVYCPEFWKKEGFGSLAFVGDTEAGKTEITILGLGLYGLNKFFLGASRDTLAGIEQKMNSVNAIPVVIDDLGKHKMTGDTANEEFKRLSHGLARGKCETVTKEGTKPPCCPFGFSTNYLPVEKPEIMNRILYLDTENLTFNPKKFQYFGKGVEELSCILPHILDIGFERVNLLHNERKDWLLVNYKGISDRMASQIAIAIAGLDIFNHISKTNLPIPWDKFNGYISTCMERFETAKSPLDKLLEVFPIMIWNGNIREGEQYKITEDDGLIKLYFHKKATCLAYNKFVAMDSSEHILSRSLKNKSSDTYKVLAFDRPQDYNGKKNSSIVLDITNHPSVDVIMEKHILYKNGQRFQ